MGLKQTVRYNLGYMVFIASLAALSIFFTVEVESYRGASAKARLTESIATGLEVTIAEVVDGDEIVVNAPEVGNFVVRLLGIKSFDPSANDPHIVGFGQAAVAYLERTLVGTQGTLEFDEFKKDDRDRVLAYVASNAGEDVGLAMVARGLSLVYIQYPFSRESEYLQAQARARNRRAGLWGTDKAAQRARALQGAWEAARER